ncbi:transcriptional repressor [Shimia biformata]|uniref:transcriptional repressor n=1 Tax=Shimia biformata TaxID=1294299 RepID=UPI00194E6004|nr:transcriptional repressor [Shimia biformata]
MDPLGFSPHNHDHCISDGVAAADAQCRAKGLQLTPVRRRVLEILLQEHRAMGAYDILDHLRNEGLGSQPPVAYRALDFLVKHGFAHKIERLNAFVACAHPEGDHAPVFLICRDCNSVAESDGRTVRKAMADTASQSGFAIDRSVVEALGLCPNCREGHAE